MPDDQYRYTDPATTQLPPLTPSPTRRVSGWVADPDEPSGWRWMPDVSAIAAATQILPIVPAPEGRVDFQGAVDWAWPSDGADAEAAGGYVYTDPTSDDAWPRITEAIDDAPDAFPDSWSGAPTERDQAAIDAGNA